MSVAAVAHKDFQDAVRSKALWVLSVLYVLFACGITYAYVVLTQGFGADPAAISRSLVFFIAGFTSLFVSLTAIVLSYKSIAGERESGSVMLLLGLPHSRSDVLLGKVVGRSAVLAVPTVIGFGLAFVLATIELGTVDPLVLGAFVLTTVAFVVTYVSIVVGISALTAATGRAAALAISFFFVFEMLWGALTMAFAFVVNGLSLPQTQPDWLFVVRQVAPSNAYTTALRALVPGAAPPGSVGELEAVWATPWVGVLMLAFWIVVPLGVGYAVFQHTDI